MDAVAGEEEPREEEKRREGAMGHRNATRQDKERDIKDTHPLASASLAQWLECLGGIELH